MAEKPKLTAEALAQSGGSTYPEQSGTEQTSAAGDLPDLPRTAKTDLARKQEAVRGTVTYWLMVLLGIVLVLGFYGAIEGGEAWTNTRDWLQTAVPAVTGLLGSAMGFYFGSRRA